MTLHMTDWTPSGVFNLPLHPTFAERVLARVEAWASASRARMESRRLERVHYRNSARGSPPGLSNHLRQDIGLPPYGSVDVDLYY